MLRRLVTLNCDTNLTPEDTIRESVHLYNKARKSIHIVAGSLDAPFYRDPQVIGALKEAAARGVAVFIIYDKTKLKGEAPQIELFSSFNVELKPSASVKRHFTVIDGRHVRIEKRHEDEPPQTPAVICKDARLLAQEMDNRFEVLAGAK